MHKHPEYLKSFDYIGPHRYFLTFCTHGRRPLFTNTRAVQLVRDQIVRAAHEQCFSITVYCFMPDHLHILVYGETPDADCKRFLARAKQYSGYYFAREYGGRLWQRYGFERLLRKEDATLSVARYIFENPVRAGLAETMREYPHLGSEAYSIEDVIDAIAWSD